MDELLRFIPRLWRGDRVPVTGACALPTGFAELDRELPGGGWPVGAIVELLIGTAGIGELRLLLPILRRLLLSGDRVLLINPPHVPNAVAFRQAGIDPDGLLLLQPEQDRAALWSAEQALRNPGCGAVLLWPRGDRAVGDRETRRLQLAAAEGQSILFLHRCGAKQSSRFAALRLELLPADAGLEISVLKAAGTHRRPRIRVSL
jgi:protein ImuA